MFAQCIAFGKQCATIWYLVEQPDRGLGRPAAEWALIPDQRLDIRVIHDRLEAVQIQHVGSIRVDPLWRFVDKRDQLLQVDAQSHGRPSSQERPKADTRLVL